ncbi:MAG: hypothetical protein JXA36_01775, partial [Coriobacteriia bacterium]|nr:hypothetical protein [Coriobacteriia bacterium]
KADVPYIEHALRVAARLDDEMAKTVAVLHDVLEDTATTEAQLLAVFPEGVVRAVRALTRRDDESFETYYERVRSDPVALAVKYADIHDNLDPVRLRLLDLDEASRLRRKYGEALVLLAGAAAAD